VEMTNDDVSAYATEWAEAWNHRDVEQVLAQ
jgi:ketosteroid isomerase-like protein